jgi:microcystin-dependent protein
VTDERVYNEGLVSAAIAEKINGGAYTPAGAIIPFGGATAPSGYLECDGSAVSRTTYAALYAAIGTTWGSGDGSTTFNLPDLRETALVGIGTRGSGVTAHDTYTLGQFKDDQEQSHIHQNYAISSSLANSASGGSGHPLVVELAAIGAPIADGANGTPRVGTTTHGKQAGVLYCIKY